jgi:hypothetical protein
MPEHFPAHAFTGGMLDCKEHNHNNVKACPNGHIIEFLVELAMSNIFARACDVLGRKNLLPELWMSGWLQHPRKGDPTKRANTRRHTLGS